MMNLADAGTWENALLINWFHVVVICMNTYMAWSFFKRIRQKQPSTPLAYLSSYITLAFWLAFLFVYMDCLPPNIEPKHLYLLLVYAGCDALLLLFSWLIQLRVVSRRYQLMSFKANNVTDEKKEDDLFDVRYLPEEYMSDV